MLFWVLQVASKQFEIMRSSTSAKTGLQRPKQEDLLTSNQQAPTPQRAGAEAHAQPGVPTETSPDLHRNQGSDQSCPCRNVERPAHAEPDTYVGLLTACIPEGYEVRRLESADMSDQK